MVNPDLVNYLQEGVRRGFNIELLLENLIHEGWPKEFILEAEKYVKEKNFKFKKLPSTKIEFRKIVPFQVKLISILNYFIAFSIIFITVYSIYIQNILNFIPPVLFESFSFGLIGISIIFSLIPFFLGLGIYRGKNMARLFAIVIGICVILLDVFNMSKLTIFQTVVFLIAVYTVAYLSFGKKCKEYFLRNG